jgi:antitoxin PrlF
MRITSKGQVTIPRAIRERYGLLPGIEVEFVATRHSIQILKSTNLATRGQNIVRRLRGRSTVRMSTDEILALTRT